MNLKHLAIWRDALAKDYSGEGSYFSIGGGVLMLGPIAGGGAGMILAVSVLGLELEFVGFASVSVIVIEAADAWPGLGFEGASDGGGTRIR